MWGEVALIGFLFGFGFFFGLGWLKLADLLCGVRWVLLKLL
jgi:hypothetical protein